MNDEIKEILEKPNVYIFNDECYLYFGDYNKLKDYITNLQEEKDDAVQCLKYYEEGHFLKPAIDNTKLTMELANAYMKDINNLQEEVKAANESITWWQNRFNAVEEENKELKKKITFNEKCRRKMEQSLMKQIHQLKEEMKTLYKYTPEKGFRLVGDEE